MPDQNTESETRLLLIDDDTKFCRLISDYLHRYGFIVTSVHNGLEGLKRCSEESFDAVVLDVMLPGLSGLQILTNVRSRLQIPIVMLTAVGDESDRIVGLELGADDYVPKISSPRELLARLRAVLRRNARFQSVSSQAPVQLVVGSLLLDLEAREATLEAEPLHLTPVEFDLLTVLVQAAGRVKSREQLLNEIRDRHYDVFDRSIDVHISALRRKLGDDPKHPKFIRTVRAAGYMLLKESTG